VAQEHIRTDLGMGLALDFDRGELNRVVEGYLPLLDAAEESGLGSVWAGEGWDFSGVSGGHVGAPLLILASLSGHTSLRLGTGVTLLPSWHPLRLAQEGAVLDRLTGGRFTLGVGAGRPALWQRFGLADVEMGKWLDDAIRAIRTLWSGTAHHQGDVVDVEGPVPPPVQEGGPPVWVAGHGRRATRRAGLLGDAWYASSSATLDSIRHGTAQYRSALEEAGRDGGRVAVNRVALVADSDAEARRLATVHLEEWSDRYRRLGLLEDGLGSDPWEAVGLVGSAERVAHLIADYRDAGVTDLHLRVAPAPMPLDVAEQTIRAIPAITPLL
jgi:alkanesulfonate monooxygenase SsuD/methylene tetrahydromethanopterin reductase-like flavin-dependent oxidoreductase (luciferase family)